jgi:HTH-type transcriptional regulator/antitoxin HipB
MLIHTPKELGLYIREQRKAQGLSQTMVGEAVNIKQATISDFENKPEASQIDTLFRILSAANLELHVVPKGESAPEQPWDEAW